MQLISNLCNIIFPIGAVKGSDIDLCDTGRVQAVDISRDATGMRARHVERFDAAGLAKEVGRSTGIEAVVGQSLFALDELEVILVDNEMEEAGGVTDRAIAGKCFDCRRAAYLKSHCAAMAAAPMGHILAHAVLSGVRSSSTASMAFSLRVYQSPDNVM